MRSFCGIFCPQKEIAEVLIMRSDGDFQAFNHILIIYLENAGVLYSMATNRRYTVL